jgi:GT2 family glycosyltransferase
MDVSVIVLNYRTPEQSVHAAKSALAAADELRAEAVVVDNGSGDGSAEIIRQSCPEARLVELPVNLGFAGGMNAGIRESSGEYVLLLNSDVEATQEALGKLIEHMNSNSDVGVAAPALVDENGKPSRTMILQPTLWRVFAPFVGRLGHERWLGRIGTEPLDVEAIEGAAVMVRRTAIEKAGLLDEDFFFYHEIVEWCARMQDHGYRVAVVPKARMTHLCGGATKGLRMAARVELKRSEYQLLRKRLGAAVCWAAIGRDFVRETVSTLFYGLLSTVTLGMYRRSREKLAVHSAVLMWLAAGRPRRQSGVYVRLFGRWD